MSIGEQTISAFIFYGMTCDKEKFKQAQECFPSGMLELCGAAVTYATLMQELFERCTETLEVFGVYDYDVAEVFGRWFRDRIIEYRGCRPILPDRTECEDQIRKLVTAFFYWDGPHPQDPRGVISDFFKGRSK